MDTPSVPLPKCCTKCGEEFPATPEYFHRNKSAHDGLHPRCKTCRNQDGLEYLSKPGKREQLHKTQKARSLTEDGQKYARDYVRKWRRDHQFTEKARRAISQDIHRKRLPSAKTLTCVNCGAQAEHYHHHLGYEQEHWHHVIPLCLNCHKNVHKATPIP
jgi:hypothetical protein